ncbi:hypothetical protein BC628DRAFT_479470 [Trametes gibbosa]|nr:hypothetical protein BC628DRAFT_479470 [Trametes gibbosa]
MSHVYARRTFSWSRRVRFSPLPDLLALRVRACRPPTTLVPPAHRFSRPSGVSNTSASCSSRDSSSSWLPNRFPTGVASSARLFANVNPLGGDGVDSGPDETAVVAVDVDGIRRFRAGVENVEVNEPREMSGTVPADCVDVSARALSAADIVVRNRRRCRRR